jgi:hypothetical protein
VDGQGKLFSIDHEKVYWSNGSDVEMLASNIRRPSRAYSAVARVVNTISPRGMEALFDGLPDLPWALERKAKRSPTASNG